MNIWRARLIGTTTVCVCVVWADFTAQLHRLMQFVCCMDLVGSGCTKSSNKYVCFSWLPSKFHIEPVHWTALSAIPRCAMANIMYQVVIYCINFRASSSGSDTSRERLERKLPCLSMLGST